MLEIAVAVIGSAVVTAAEQGHGFFKDPAIGLLRYLALTLSVVIIIVVVYKIFIKREGLANTTTRWLLLIVIVILSPLAYLTSFSVGVQASKPVEFCNSCHVMDGYVSDLKDPDSEHIASLHYHYRWISEKQCYACHSDYGMFGDAGAKFDGIRHIWAYYTGRYESPLEIRLTYNNERCLFCHAPVDSYQDIDEHIDNEEDIASNEMSCFGAECHVSPHPEEAAEIGQ